MKVKRYVLPVKKSGRRDQLEEEIATPTLLHRCGDL